MTRKAETQNIDAVLERAASLGREFLAGLAERRVAPPVAVETLRRTLGGPLPDAGEDPCAVVETLARGADPGIVASVGPRYFGFVTGGALPAAVGADWLTSAWDQNAWTYVASPAASVIEALAGVSGPAIVCAQAGEVNTGSFDPLDQIAALCHQRGAWLHVDGAFGLWAAASPALRHLVRGADGADSWTVDGHKWLNVPYDSGYVLVRDGAAHRAALAVGAPYYPPNSTAERENFHFVPESSRRARGFPTWAALRSLGRRGVAELVEHCCALARRMADILRVAEGVEVLNEVVLNQVLVRFRLPSGDADAFTREVIHRIQAAGTCWLGGTTWRGRAAARISISNASTTEADVDRSAAAILACVRAAGR